MKCGPLPFMRPSLMTKAVAHQRSSPKVVSTLGQPPYEFAGALVPCDAGLAGSGAWLLLLLLPQNQDL